MWKNILSVEYFSCNSSLSHPSRTPKTTYQHWSLYNICTIVVQYLYNCKRTNIVQVLYIYCTTTGVGTLKYWFSMGEFWLFLWRCAIVRHFATYRVTMCLIVSFCCRVVVFFLSLHYETDLNVCCNIHRISFLRLLTLTKSVT